MKDVTTQLQSWIEWQPRPAKPAIEPPLRAELFSVDQLARHARVMAGNHRFAIQNGPSQLLSRLQKNEQALNAFNRATLEVNLKRSLTPAAEWLLDNYYLIEEQIQLARRHLPRGYSRELPRLIGGPTAGVPRVYDLVLELISHVDAQIDLDPLRIFIAAYQEVSFLKLGELWAIPIMLRLGLIENLHRVTARLTVARRDRDVAGLWVNRLQTMAEKSPSLLVVVVAEMAKSDISLSSSFVAEFSQQLSLQGQALHLARGWLDQRLVEEGSSIEQKIQQESQAQATDQVTVSHSVASLRLLGSTDWRDFVERLSIVETVLGTDPSAVYGTMDFATRDSYRHSIEFFARHSGRSEEAVSKLVVDVAAKAAARLGSDDRSAHVGFYLIDKGRREIGAFLKVRRPLRSRVEQGILRFPLTFYAGSIGFLTLLATLAAGRAAGVAFWAGWKPACLGVLVALCFSQLAVAVVNWISMILVKPRLLPRIDYTKGIAADRGAMVVIPTLLSSAGGIDRLVETLEIHHLSNRDPNLHFALLTDFRDGSEEAMPGDEALLERARQGIAMLNRKYLSVHEDLFFLIHRPRRWNPVERLWMGYERKRGKLAEFNGLLRGIGPKNFSDVVGNTAIFPRVKYVVTVDTDTLLPRDVVRQLVGSMAHPLNRPLVDPATGIVTEGYGILQPRTGVSLSGARRSLFARLFAGGGGIDPYTREVSDVYQDVFQEGSYTGKGIYDVDVFETALGGRFPENAILSHDLLEASHARSALVSDVAFFEEFPARHNVDMARRHRWMRGDWQIAQWLFSRVPGARGRSIANPLSALSQWKILDNLRRSLVPVALMIVLLAGWLVLPRLAEAGFLVVLAVLVLPSCLPTFSSLLEGPGELSTRVHLVDLARGFLRQLCQAVLHLAFLPYDAYVSADAVVRTLLRLLVTHRRLLEWRTSTDSEGAPNLGLAGFFVTMWAAPATAVLVGLGLGLGYSPPWGVAAPVAALWLVSPWIAWRISQPVSTRSPILGAVDRAFLRRTARMTWRFFETFVTAKENWLPPDNFQEVPSPRIASRTSPTNMGLALLANLSARDFGYVSSGGVLRRARDALSTMGRLEGHRGHLYNWYDTRTLRPLLPLYVSTVDSGNLAGHLLTHGSGLREWADEPILSPQLFQGLHDTAAILLGLAPQDPRLKSLAAALASGPKGLRASLSLLSSVCPQAEEAAGALAGADGEAGVWARSLAEACRDHLDDLKLMAPWLSLNGPAAEPDSVPTLRQVAAFTGSGDAEGAGSALGLAMREASERARSRMTELEELAALGDRMAAMDFQFLYHADRELFSTGYNVSDRRFDPGFYDLLASEARLCSYVAIALGQVPQDHWFSLGRLLVTLGGEQILVSWGGSMFEYLMPLLVMPSYENTLIDGTYGAAVRQQIGYGDARGVPWGVSESGYNRTDADLNYQYQAFGVPGMGLKRGLADDMVIAPYATAIALMVAPAEACENLQRLAKEGHAGAYGHYEAVDYTPSRLPPGEENVTIRSFMAHHQGMSLVALDNLLHDRPMQRRFMACPLLKAADLLLQERVPKAASGSIGADLASEAIRTLPASAESVTRVITNPGAPAPEVQLLSNGHYHVVVTGAGGGYSRWRNLAVTRWREDATRDDWGTFVYLRDVGTGEFFSATFQPVLRSGANYKATFTQGRAEFQQSVGGFEVHSEICVSPEDDVEVRRMTIANLSSVERQVEVTSYAEVVLATPASDDAHPAFSNLFVQTEFDPDSSAVLCTRRRRYAEEMPPWLLHLMVVAGDAREAASCETDRMKFIGRNGSPANPEAMGGAGPLSNTVGSVLDPIVALRRTLTLPPHASVIVDLVTGMADSRETILAQREKYKGSRMTERAFDLAWTHSQVTLRQLGVTEAEAQVYGRLAGALVYADHSRRAAASVLANNVRGQSGLWSYGISGDTPIVLLRISAVEKIEIVRQLIQAHAYWRTKGLMVELVILSADVSIYRKSLHDQITSLIASGTEAQMLDKPGGIFVRRLDQVPYDDLGLLQASARIFLDDENGPLASQLAYRRVLDPPVAPFVALRPARKVAPAAAAHRELLFNNGLGGFTKDGREYVITLQAGQSTPAPWVNVLANASFGTVVSERGSSYTWAENAHEFRLTPWGNDPVRDGTGEAIYLRDQQTGQFWCPTPGPMAGTGAYVIRHGFGYSVFEHTENGIASELWVYVATDAPVKFMVLKLRNTSGVPRRVSCTGYFEWVLCDQRQKSLLHVRTEIDLKTGALLARNGYNAEFSGKVAFLDVDDGGRTFTGDRREFIGRNGSLADPRAMKRARLSGKVGCGIDPCGAVQVSVDLPDAQEREVTFRLGAASGLEGVRDLVRRFRAAGAGRAALEGVWDTWNRTLGAVTVTTPDPGINVMANGWLLYQTLACRIWGRTALYQSSGAYGFRDQLQDVMALVHSEPAIAREHLLRCASKQFPEGDVLHWWHPPSGRGVRTQSSDDYLWLPYALCRYVRCVADTGVLDEKVHFVEGRPVKPLEESYYDLPNRSESTDTLYQHAVRAVERGLQFGAHGLPLIGCGDWNDGMDRVGNLGRGESVWLAFFLYDVLVQFSSLARDHGDRDFADRCLAESAKLQENIEKGAWDGAWYRRAYYDDGQPMGSKAGAECRIDSIPQSWSVISGAGMPERSRMAMDSVDSALVRRDLGLVQLFDPPFDKGDANPGYIKGYVPGVRENGGQYTHGAVWTAIAFAMLGDAEKAWEIVGLINPISHSSTAANIAVYKVEPYVAVADVYAFDAHKGHGGWSWYTGSAGWMYRLIVESLLGINLEGDRLRLSPLMPKAWPAFKIDYRYRRSVYHISIVRVGGGVAPDGPLTVDGVQGPGDTIQLRDDQAEHMVELRVI